MPAQSTIDIGPVHDENLLKHVRIHGVASLRPFLDAVGNSWWTARDGANVPYKAISDQKAILTREQWMEADACAAEAFKNAAPIAMSLVQRKLVTVVGMDRSALNVPLTEQPLTTVDMSVATPPKFETKLLPLPFTHADCVLAEKTWPAGAAEEVGKYVDSLILGIHPGSYSDIITSAIPGLRSHPDRITLHAGWGSSPILELRKEGHYGPFLTIHPKVQEYPRCFRTDYVETPQLEGRESIVVNATADTIRLVVGLDPVLVQWEDHFKFLCIIVPQFRVRPGQKLGVVQCR